MIGFIIPAFIVISSQMSVNEIITEYSRNRICVDAGWRSHCILSPQVQKSIEFFVIVFLPFVQFLKFLLFDQLTSQRSEELCKLIQHIKGHMEKRCASHSIPSVDRNRKQIKCYLFHSANKSCTHDTRLKTLPLLLFCFLALFAVMQ